MVRCYAVFNVEQADGLTLERKGDDREPPPEWKAHQTAERVIQESGIRVVHERGDRAFYNMQTDKVTLPEREQFATANGYYQTALHELGHATGHPDRMDRDTLKHGGRATVSRNGALSVADRGPPSAAAVPDSTVSDPRASAGLPAELVACPPRAGHVSCVDR